MTFKQGLFRLECFIINIIFLLEPDYTNGPAFQDMIKGIRNRIKLFHKDPNTDQINPFHDNGFPDLDKNGFPFNNDGSDGQLGRISDQEALLLAKIMLGVHPKDGLNKKGLDNVGYTKDGSNKSDLNKSGLDKDVLNNAGRNPVLKDVSKVNRHFLLPSSFSKNKIR